MKNLKIVFSAAVIIAFAGYASAQMAGAPLSGPSVNTSTPPSGIIMPNLAPTKDEVKKIEPVQSRVIDTQAELNPLDYIPAGPVPIPTPKPKQEKAELQPTPVKTQQFAAEKPEKLEQISGTLFKNKKGEMYRCTETRMEFGAFG